ncbi:hypothetical protein RQN9TF_30835 (plasmid) [Rhodococcus qingshengii]|uniref:hypothetical protein n=1 Tax=Rhodococcus TaxID=1827 RepID=UPI000F625B15|nr:MULTISPECIES: hypothetical protein [Rhodococcus]AZI65712.1 hypothetical protein EHW12_31870 [Rhodococcus sp. NJ-530]UGQ55880.1 hypothetical protein LRL17_33920 [Rhodococcus qingshengii]BDQ23648.1 hypothetical protein RQN9TF_30835 [Rhodococcus qingshengii]
MHELAVLCLVLGYRATPGIVDSESPRGGLTGGNHRIISNQRHIGGAGLEPIYHCRGFAGLARRWLKGRLRTIGTAVRAGRE